MDLSLLVQKQKAPKRADSPVSRVQGRPSQTNLDRVKFVISKHPSERTESQIETVMFFTRELQFFTDLRNDVGEYFLYECCRAMTYEESPPGKCVLREGDTAGRFYIILSGSCAVVGNSDAPPIDAQLLKVLRAGDYFGDREEPSSVLTASVYCREACSFAVLEHQHYGWVLQRLQDKQTKDKVETLRSSSLFADWSQDNLEELAKNSRVKTVRRREALFLQGKVPSSVYLIQDGVFKLTVAGASNNSPQNASDGTSASAGTLLCAGNALRKTNYEHSCHCLSAKGSALTIPAKCLRRLMRTVDSRGKARGTAGVASSVDLPHRCASFPKLIDNTELHPSESHQSLLPRSREVSTVQQKKKLQILSPEVFRDPKVKEFATEPSPLYTEDPPKVRRVRKLPLLLHKNPPRLGNSRLSLSLNTSLHASGSSGAG